MGRIDPNDADKYQNSLNGEWFQLKNDGDIARVQFMHDKYEDIEVYACHKEKIGDKERYVSCLRTYDQAIDDCPLCAQGSPVKPVRFIIMYQHDDGKVKIWERGKNFMSKLQGLFNRYSPLSNYVFEIERHGVAGDKETKYETFPMDRIAPVDLNEVENPELLGGLILDKSFEEMEVFLQTGNFPVVNEEEQAPQTRQTTGRRAPVAAAAPAANQRTSRGTNTTGTSGVATRRGTPTPEPSQQPSSRATSRSARGTKGEVF